MPKTNHLAPAFLAPLTPCNLPVRRCPVPRERASRRVLIMRLGAHGDILMGTPLLAALRDADPECHLTWIVEHSEAQAVDANPNVDEVIRWDSRYWKRLIRRGLYPLWLARALAFRRELRRRRYDVLISFQPEEWPTLVWGAGAPVSVGVFDTFRRFYRAARTSPRTRLYAHAYAHPDLPAHRTDQYLLALQALGLPAPESPRMTMGFTADDDAAAAAWLAEAGVPGGERFVVLAPMTTWPTKCWPGERYAAFADALAARHGCHVVLIGAGRERTAIEAVAASMGRRPAITAGALTFRQMAALLTRAALVVSGDTGPMHTAAAVGTPQVALFGPTSPDWYGPRGGRAVTLLHPVPCGPCDQKVCPLSGDDHMRCMRLITVGEALAAAEGLLAAPPLDR